MKWTVQESLIQNYMSLFIDCVVTNKFDRCEHKKIFVFGKKCISKTVVLLQS